MCCNTDINLVRAFGDLIQRICYICETPSATAETAVTGTPQRSFNGHSARQAFGTTNCYPNPLCVFPIGNANVDGI